MKKKLQPENLMREKLFRNQKIQFLNIFSQIFNFKSNLIKIPDYLE